MATWFRTYAEARHNPKIQRLPLATFRAWFNLLCLTCERDGHLPPIEDIAFELRLSMPATRRLLAELQEKRLLDVSGDRMLPHNWNERQFKADVSTNRVRAFRERKSKQDETVSCNDEGNGFVTPPDTETDTEQKVTPLRPPSDRRGERLAPDWRPSPDDEATAAALGLDPQEIADGFRDYWHAKPGAAARKLDWAATWRTWCRTEAQRRTRGPSVAGGAGRNGGYAAALRTAVARVRGADPVPR
jgi:hypothetical protein